MCAPASGLLLLISAAACQGLPPHEPSASPAGSAAGLQARGSDAGEPQRGLAFVQGACGGCHAVEHPGLSPNPEAPPFAAIANREGLNAATLSSWLREAHNYPEEMDFALDSPQVDLIVEYMLSLQDEAYRPPIG